MSSASDGADPPPAGAPFDIATTAFGVVVVDRTFLILDGRQPHATPNTKAVPLINTQSIGKRDARGSTKMEKRCSKSASTSAAGVDVDLSSSSGEEEEEEDEENEDAEEKSLDD